MKLRWSRRSQSDLIEIGRYIATDNRPAARKWVERLRERARQAAEHPLSGRVVPEHSRQDLREMLLRNYRIVYRAGDEGIEILTVFEGHRAFPDDALPSPDR